MEEEEGGAVIKATDVKTFGDRSKWTLSSWDDSRSFLPLPLLLMGLMKSQWPVDEAAAAVAAEMSWAFSR